MKEDSMLGCMLLLLGVPLSEAFVRQPSAAATTAFQPPKYEKPSFFGSAAAAASPTTTSSLRATDGSPWDSLEQKLLGDSSGGTSTASKVVNSFFSRGSSTDNVLSETVTRQSSSTITSSKPAATVVEDSMSGASDILSNLLKETRNTATEPSEDAASSFLDQTAANAQSILDSAKELASLRVTTNTDSAMNSLGNVQQQAQDAAAAVPDSLLHLEETARNLLKGAPPGEGLSKPIVDYVMKTLYDMRDSPYNPPNWIDVQIPSDFVTLPGGFQAKTCFIDAISDATYTGIATAVETKSRLTGFAPYFVDNLKISYAHSAPMREKMVSAVQAVPEVLSREYQFVAERTAQAGKSLANTGLDWDSWKLSVDKLAIVQADMQQLLRTPGWRPEDVLETLNMKELGPFYVGIAAAMLLALSYNNQRLASLSKDVNGPVVSAPRKPSPRMRTAAPKTMSSGPGEQAQLENIVADLTQATAILAAEMKGMATELKELKGKQQMEMPVAPTMMQSTSMNAVSQAVVEAEDELAKKLLELEMQNELLRNQLTNAKFEADTLSEVNDALNAGVEALAGMSKEPVVPQTPSTVQELGLTDAYFVSGLSGLTTEKESASSKTAVMDAPDWSNLSLGALKQKTEAELREYLESKGLRGKDEKGQPLAKPDLLALVMATA